MLTPCRWKWKIDVFRTCLVSLQELTKAINALGSQNETYRQASVNGPGWFDSTATVQIKVQWIKVILWLTSATFMDQIDCMYTRIASQVIFLTSIGAWRGRWSWYFKGTWKIASLRKSKNRNWNLSGYRRWHHRPRKGTECVEKRVWNSSNWSIWMSAIKKELRSKHRAARQCIWCARNGRGQLHK